LSKSGSALAVPHALVIGDGSNAPGTASAVHAGSEQVAVGPGVTLNHSGAYDLDGFDQHVAQLTMSGGTVETGAGLLSVTDHIVVPGAPFGSTINGRLAITPTGSLLEVPVDLTDNAAVAEELRINAVITGGIIELRGSGRLVTPGVSTFVGVIIE